MMISATSGHHWSKDIRVEVKDQSITWFKNNVIIPDPRTPQEMIEHIDRMLKFTACGPKTEGGTIEELIALLYNQSLEFDIQLVYINICGCNMGNCYTVRNVTLEEEKIHTYGDALEVIATADISQYCYWEGRKPTYLTCDSLVEALKKYNMDINPSQIKKHMYDDPKGSPHWYDYMDSVILKMKIIKKLPDVYDFPYHKEYDQHYSKKPDIQLDPNITYVSVEWSR